MRKLAVGIFIMMLVFLVAATATGQDRPIVAVFDIEIQDVKLLVKTTEKLNNYLCSLLAQKTYQVVPRAKLKESLQEKKKESYKQCYDQACQIEIGQELAAQKSLSTQVLKLGGKCKVTLTLYDLRRSTSEKGTAVSGGCDEAQIVESLETAVEQLLGSGTGQPPAAPQPPVPAQKAGLTWVKSVPAGIEFTKSEITVAQYRTCVEAGKCDPAHFDDGTCLVYSGQKWEQGKLPTSFRGEDQPMVCVDSIQAAEFCGWVGGRLPTEEEWYAEASNKGTRQYPWGDQEVTCAQAVINQAGAGCGRYSTWPVCSKEKGNSVSGMCDMSGNVWEWTSSSEGSKQAVRGGSWGYGIPENSASHRNLAAPTYLDASLGFRCGRASR